MSVTVHHGDCLAVLPTLGRLFDSVVCDPPYHLHSITKRFANSPRTEASVGKHAYGRHATGFMGTTWDGGDVAFKVETWRAVFDVMKPGAYLIAFASTRGYHRMVCAIEDAGFLIHPMIGWIFGTGFPKATDLSKQFDKRGGVWRGRSTRALPNQSVAKGIEYERAPKGDPVGDEARQWDGWAYGAQSLKPALEPICMAQKPIDGKRMIDNVRKHGVGAVNIDACRIGFASQDDMAAAAAAAAAQRACHDQNAGRTAYGDFNNGPASLAPYLAKMDQGRWPANLCHDGSDHVIASFPDTGISSGGSGEASRRAALNGIVYEGGYSGATLGEHAGGIGDSGSAARYFYSAKASEDDRAGSKHPTVKPVSLVRWLVRLVTPPGGTVLDCFAGSGTTGVACIREGFDCVLVEREAEYIRDIRSRLDQLSGLDAPLFAGMPA